MELFGAEHGFGRVGCVEARAGGAEGAGVEEEEGGWAVGEGCVCCVLGMAGRRRGVEGGVVDVEGVESGRVGGRGAGVPVVGDLVIIEDV